MAKERIRGGSHGEGLIVSGVKRSIYIRTSLPSSKPDKLLEKKESKGNEAHRANEKRKK